jgi:hypothetical protein
MQISRFLGTTTPALIESQLRMAQRDIRLLHFEVVIRNNLLDRFEKQRHKMISQAIKNSGSRRERDERADKAGKWEVNIVLFWQVRDLWNIS